MPTTKRGRVRGWLRPMLAATPLLAGAAAAAEPSLLIELNKLEPAGSACRAHFLFENRSPIAYPAIKLDLVLFDVNGVIAARLAVDMAPVRASKTSVKAFAVEGLDCQNIGKLLLNDVLECATEAGDADCLSRIETASRATVPFLK